jgi:hypothetical protein
MYAVTATYASKEEPTVDELKSELAAAQASHQHANRALTNMSVALSDAMDRVVALQERERKMKLEHDARCAGLAQELVRFGNERKQGDEAAAKERERADALQAQIEALLGGKGAP